MYKSNINKMDNVRKLSDNPDEGLLSQVFFLPVQTLIGRIIEIVPGVLE